VNLKTWALSVNVKISLISVYDLGDFWLSGLVEISEDVSSLLKVDFTDAPVIAVIIYECE